MSTPPKVFALPFALIDAILERADIPAQAGDVAIGQDSPVSPRRQLLPSDVIDALRRARSDRHLIGGDRQMVMLRPADAPALSRWLRDLAAEPGVADTERARFRDAADTIDHAP
jgi:hypothetical protein